MKKRGGRRNKRHRPLFVYTGLVHVKKLLVLDRTRGALKQGEEESRIMGRNAKWHYCLVVQAKQVRLIDEEGSGVAICGVVCDGSAFFCFVAKACAL